MRRSKVMKPNTVSDTGIIIAALECFKRHNLVYPPARVKAVLDKYEGFRREGQEYYHFLQLSRPLERGSRFFVADGVTYDDVKHLGKDDDEI
jgi:hypothetical protein